MTASSVLRTIHFYRAEAGYDDAGDRLPIDFAHLLESIECLPFTRDGSPSRYEWESNDAVHCAVFDPPDTHDAFKFCRVRNSGLPELERGGEITGLRIEDDQGLAESIHVVFFSDNVVGIEQNRDGPSTTRLAWYLTSKSGNILRPVRLHHLIRHNPVARLNQLRDLTVLDLEIHSSYAEAIAEDSPPLPGAFRGVHDSVGVTEAIRLALKFPKDERGFRRFAQSIIDLVSSPSFINGAKSFKVQGTNDETGRIDIINLLGDQIVSRRDVELAHAQHRAVDTQAAFKAIRDAYLDLSDDIARASSLVQS